MPGDDGTSNEPSCPGSPPLSGTPPLPPAKPAREEALLSAATQGHARAPPDAAPKGKGTGLWRVIAVAPLGPPAASSFRPQPQEGTAQQSNHRNEGLVQSLSHRLWTVAVANMEGWGRGGLCSQRAAGFLTVLQLLQCVINR
jgi:hypothetical protein